MPIHCSKSLSSFFFFFKEKLETYILKLNIPIKNENDLKKIEATVQPGPVWTSLQACVCWEEQRCFCWEKQLMSLNRHSLAGRGSLFPPYYFCDQFVKTDAAPRDKVFTHKYFHKRAF